MQHFDQVEVLGKVAPVRDGELLLKRKRKGVSAIIVLQGLLIDLTAGFKKSCLGIVILWAQELHDAMFKVDEGVDVASYFHGERQ